MKQFNNGHLKRAILKSYSCEIEKLKSGSLECTFLNDKVDIESRIRVILVEGNAYSDAQGIHIRRLNSNAELNESVSDAIETALKDNFNHIWIHNPTKQTPERQAHRAQILIGWMEANEKTIAGNYPLNKLTVDATKVISGMTGEQLDVVLALVSGTYSRAHDESRANWVPLYRTFSDEARKRMSKRAFMKLLDTANTAQFESKQKGLSHD